MGKGEDEGRGGRRWSRALEAISLGPYFGACLLIGFLGGSYVDKRLGLSVPWFTIAGVLLGSAAGFRQLFLFASRIGNDRTGKK